MAITPLIAVVDADASFRDLIAEFLSEEGFEVLLLEERDAICESIRARKPALVLLELLLTDQEHGWTVLNTLRRDLQTRQLPVIITSTATRLIARSERQLRAQACDVLLKPFDLDDLLLLVGRYMPAVEQHTMTRGTYACGWSGAGSMS